MARFTLIIDRNIETFREEPSLDPKAVQQLSQLSHRQLKQALRLLRDRAAAGMVRRCHGDAHLGNIVLIDDKPVLFDAIEFDPVIATTDLLYDLAFPFRPEERQTVCSTNISKTLGQSASALRLLPLFLSVRRYPL